MRLVVLGGTTWLGGALIAKALKGDVGALREAIHQLVGRPTEVVQGNPERPIRIVVESISARVHAR